MGPHAFRAHEKSAGHVRALASLPAKQAARQGEAEGGSGILAVATGINDSVPRIDRFRLAGVVVARRDTFRESQLQRTAVGGHCRSDLMCLPRTFEHTLKTAVRRICQSEFASRW